LYLERVAMIKNDPAGAAECRDHECFVVECRLIQGYTSSRKD